MDYSRFHQVYANIPMKIREQIVVVIDDKPLSWNAAFVEIDQQTKLGAEIYNKLVEMDII